MYSLKEKARGTAWALEFVLQYLFYMNQDIMKGIKTIATADEIGFMFGERGDFEE